MAAELSNPRAWIGPTLRQAKADYDVASMLIDAVVPGEIYGNSCPVDAALDKFQQALEKALKGLMLHEMPERSDLAFDHRLLTGDHAKNSRVRRRIRKALEAFKLRPDCRASFEAIEALIPDPRLAELDDHGKVISLPENTQYPYGPGKSGRIVAPCDGIAGGQRGLPLSLRKNLGTLFKALRNSAEFSGFFPQQKAR